jgi:hypothetical protein
MLLCTYVLVVRGMSSVVGRREHHAQEASTVRTRVEDTWSPDPREEQAAAARSGFMIQSAGLSLDDAAREGKLLNA